MSDYQQQRKSALITGCSEGGIGDGLAQEFLKRGFRVFATARNLRKIEHLKELGCDVLKLDVCSEEEVKAVAESVGVMLQGRGLDVLVNNAGFLYMGPLLDASIPAARQLFDTNLVSVLSVTQFFAPLLMKAKGTIVNIGSISSISAGGFTSLYAGSKAALELMTHALRIELSPFGVKVVLVTAGAVATHMHDNQYGMGTDEKSLYWPIREKIEYMLKIGTRSRNCLSTEEFAKRVVGKVLRGSGPPVVMYEGGMVKTNTFVAGLAFFFGPRIWDWAVWSVSGIRDLTKMVKERERRDGELGGGEMMKGEPKATVAKEPEVEGVEGTT